MNTAFITVWILLIGKGSAQAQQVGPEYTDFASCSVVRDSLLYQKRAFKRQCIQVNIPTTVVDITNINNTVPVVPPAPKVTQIVESNIDLTIDPGVLINVDTGNSNSNSNEHEDNGKHKGKNKKD